MNPRRPHPARFGRARLACLAALLAAGTMLGGCEQGRMLRQADAQLADGQYEQALETYSTVRKETPIKGYRQRADQGIATASRALVGGVSTAARDAAAAGKPGHALLFEARAAHLAGDKAYDPRASAYATALREAAAARITIEASDSVSTPILTLLRDRLTSTVLLREAQPGGPADGRLAIGYIEDTMVTQREPFIKSVPYVDRMEKGPNPAHATQKLRRDEMQRQVDAAQDAFQKQQTLQFATEARARDGNNVRNSQRGYAWVEAERMRKEVNAARARLATEEHKLATTPATIDVPQYKNYTFDAQRHEQQLMGQLVLRYTPTGGTEESFTKPIRIALQDESYAAQPQIKLLAKGINLPTLEDMQYRFQQQGVADALSWLGRVEAERLEQLDRNAAQGTGSLDPVEAAVAFLINSPGPVQQARAEAIDAQIYQALGIRGATALLGVEARSPSVVDIHPVQPQQAAPEAAK